MNRWGVFAIALVVRCAVAFVFFGSWDIINLITDAGDLFAGVPAGRIHVPYLPGLQLLFWTFGMLDFHTSIASGFLYKFSGCLFDAVIAAMLGDARGLRTGLLYALAPVQILVFAIHGQWDSISLAPFIAGMLLLRREGAAAAAGSGALYALSVIIKPITAPFALFFVERKRVVPLIAGAAATGVAYLVVLWLIGDPLTMRTIAYVLDYVREGTAQHLGLPVGLGVKANRFVTLAPLLLLVPLYAKGRISREGAVMIGYAFILGTSGLSAQYLSWLLPFLLLCGYERFAALYGFLAALYLAIANATSGYDGMSYAARLAFAPLRGFEWLTPSLTNVDLKVTLLAILGDFVIPLACLGFACWAVWKRERRDVPRTTSLAPLAAGASVIAVLFVIALQLPRPSKEDFHARVRTKNEAYALIHLEPDLYKSTVALPAREHVIDALTIAYAWIIAWSLAAAATRGAAATDRPAP